jgi:hypothetical protein
MGGSFVKYHGLKKIATVGWKSGGYVGIRQDWARGERSPDIIMKKIRLIHQGLTTNIDTKSCKMVLRTCFWSANVSTWCLEL